MPKTIILSHPRSGINWIRYCVEFLTHRPTPGRRKLYKNNIKGDFVFYRSHLPQLIEVPKHGDNLVLLLRNYKECMLRHRTFKRISKSAEINVRSFLNWRYMGKNEFCTIGVYGEMIRMFEIIQGKKLVLYYEDLLANSKQEMLKFFNFIEINISSLKENFNNFFDKDLEFHKNKSCDLYTYGGGSITRGKKIKHHIGQITDKEIEWFDKLIEGNLSNLYHKYLARYKGK